MNIPRVTLVDKIIFFIIMVVATWSTDWTRMQLSACHVKDGTFCNYDNIYQCKSWEIHSCLPAKNGFLEIVFAFNLVTKSFSALHSEIIIPDLCVLSCRGVLNGTLAPGTFTVSSASCSSECWVVEALPELYTIYIYGRAGYVCDCWSVTSSMGFLVIVLSKVFFHLTIGKNTSRVWQEAAAHFHSCFLALHAMAL